MLRLNRVAVRIATTLALGGSSVLVAQDTAFVFAGLSLNTTMAELQQRYPRSTFLDSLVYLSEQDSHDGISTIGLAQNVPVRRLTITFERQRAGKPTYPACESLVASITDRYGRPAAVADAQEEQARNRRFAWKSAGQSLTLNCFRFGSQPLYAERLTIASPP